MDWFRLYAEFATDPKVQMMPEAMQRRLIMLFCLQCGNGIETFHETERETALCFALRITESELSETKDLFLKRGFINPDWTIKNWGKRQYSSDSSTERVKKYRERQKSAQKSTETGHAERDETLPKRSSNALEQNRTDTEVNTLSGKPDDEPADLMQAKEAIDYLNEKTNSGFQKVETNLRMVRARLAEGFSLEVVKSVIDRQVDRWGSDPKMSEYLRPKTLFAASNFASYAGQITAKQSDWWTQAGFDSAFDAENHGCNANTAHQWRNRQRVEVPA